MKIVYSKKFNEEKLPYVEKKLFKKRIAELQSCKNLGEMQYGRPHLLRAKYTGSFGIRLGKISRLILFPIEIDPEYYTNRNGRHIKHFVTGIVIGYSPNHYRSFY